MYGFTSEIVDHGVKFTFKEIGLLVDAVYCIILLYIFCDCSHKASLNIADRVQWHLMEINLNTIDQSCVKEVIQNSIVFMRIKSHFFTSRFNYF